MNYQERYIQHQEKKKRQLMYSEGAVQEQRRFDVLSVLDTRRSQRVFTGETIEPEVFAEILKSATTAPSSCNRHGLKMIVVEERRQKELLSGILVGGIGWVHRADKIVLFWADPVAYASPNEKEFMHYCDVGFTAMAMWMASEALGVGCSYINPNVLYKDILQSNFKGEGLIFCGALALGTYEADKRAIKSIPGDLNEMLL